MIGTVASTEGSRGSLQVNYTYFGKAKNSTSGQITFVGVEKVQHRIGAGAWADTPEPVIVALGTTVEFKAIPKPSDASWPSGKPAWTGASGSGDQASQTFNGQGSNYVVSAECGNTKTRNVVVLKVIIDNYTSVTYDGLNSGTLVCRIDPSGPTPSSYSWSATWTTPAYNNPSATFGSPAGESTIIQNAHWYSTAPSPGSSGAAVYNIYCTVVINGVSVANETPASFVVGVYNPGGKCYSPGLIGTPFFTHTESNGLFICTGVTDFQRRDASVVNYYTTASQFHSKVQGHEEQHKEDYDIGYDNHLFYTEGELASMIVGLTSTNYSSLALMVGSKITEYISGENAEINNTLPEMEDRAYAVSDLIQPYFVYQTDGM